MATGERDLERPLCKTPILTPKCQKEEEEGLVMMHAMEDDIQNCIQRDAMLVKLSKEKAESQSPMTLDNDVVSRQQ